METLQTQALQPQIDRLNQQIEILHLAIEKLTQHIGTIVTDRTDRPERFADRSSTMSYGNLHHSDLVGHPGGHSAYRGYHDMMQNNKDILMDDNSLESMTAIAEKTMSPELQIQRLTAQLTAAYNRIAALEEQLLSRRVAS
jgi:TolA-binding protein